MPFGQEDPGTDAHGVVLKRFVRSRSHLLRSRTSGWVVMVGVEGGTVTGGWAKEWMGRGLGEMVKDLGEEMGSEVGRVVMWGPAAETASWGFRVRWGSKAGPAATAAKGWAEVGAGGWVGRAERSTAPRRSWPGPSRRRTRTRCCLWPRRNAGAWFWSGPPRSPPRRTPCRAGWAGGPTAGA